MLINIMLFVFQVFASAGERLRFSTDASCNPKLEKRHMLDYLLNSQPGECPTSLVMHENNEAMALNVDREVTSK